MKDKNNNKVIIYQKVIMTSVIGDKLKK